MILCVTLNPCLDKTLTAPAWRPGEVVRGRSVREVVGGKGNNVARALTRLGHPKVRPVTFFGGASGDLCELLLREEDRLDPLVTPTEAETRTILTVRTEGSPDQTAFFDPDPEITAEEAEALYHRVEGALTEGGVRAITLSGSSPSPRTHSLYADLIAMARAKRVPTFLDTYGPPLEAIWGFWPEAIQLNRREAGLHLKSAQPGDEAILGLLDRWSRHGVEAAIVTDGPGPVLARIGGQSYRVQPPRIEVVNPIGSGDSLLAGLVDARLSGLDAEATLKHAVACATANAMTWDAGAIDVEEVKRIKPHVVVEVWNHGQCGIADNERNG